MAKTELETTTTIYVVCIILGVSHGTNFPPVENAVPIPGSGTIQSFSQAQSGAYIVQTGNEDSAPNPSDEDNQNWFRDSFIGFSQDGNSEDLPYVISGEEFERLSDDQSPVATPPPDEIAQASGFPPDLVLPKYLNSAPVSLPSLPSTDIWVGGKDASNQYTIQRWVPAPFPSDAVIAGINANKNPPQSIQVAKSLPPSLPPPPPPPPPQKISKNPPITAAVVDTSVPAKQVWVNQPRVYTSLQALLQDLPAPQQVKGNPLPPPPSPPPPPPPAVISQKTIVTQPTKGVPVPPPIAITNKGGAVTDVSFNLPPPAAITNKGGVISDVSYNFAPPAAITNKGGAVSDVSFNVPVSPKTIQIQNYNGPSQPVTLNAKNSPAVTGWLLSSNAFLPQLQQVAAPPPKTSGPPPVIPAKGTAAVVNGKGPAPVIAPKSYSFGNAWILAQNPNAPYFDRVRSLVSNTVSNNFKNIPIAPPPPSPKVVAPPAPVSGKPVNTGFVAPLTGTVLFRRGYYNQKSVAPTPIVAPLPHSPKSDVLVIGKGSTVARLVPQTGRVPLAPQVLPAGVNKPCLIGNPAPTIAKGTPGVAIPQQVRVLPAVRKGAAITVNRPYSYFVWNPSTRSNFYLLPQTAQKSVPAPAPIVPAPAVTKTVPQPIVASPNRYQYLRYFRPITLANPGILDVTQGKIKGVDTLTNAPSVSSSSEAPPKEGSASVEGSSTEDAGANKEEAKSEESKEVESSESSSSSESSEEAETTIIERYAKAPDNLQQPSEEEPAFALPSEKTTTSNSELKAKPYEFGYEQTDSTGTLLHRKESSDSAGTVTGRYGYKDLSGVYRNVDYIADSGGFRATVQTNEQGIPSYNSANVNVVHDESSTNRLKDDEDVSEQVSSENFAWGRLRD